MDEHTDDPNSAIAQHLSNPDADREPLQTHAGEQVVDTRLPGADSCATRATTAVAHLAIGDSFVLVADHDPRGIRYMLAAEQPGVTSWDLLEDGPARWQARIARLAAGAPA